MTPMASFSSRIDQKIWSVPFMLIRPREEKLTPGNLQIIRSGENIASVAVENAIFQHDAVKEVAIVGMKDDLRGEEVV